MEFGGNTVKVLVDAFGRMMIMNDGGNISGVAWNDEGITDDFDNMGSMSTQFNAIRNEWGEHDCITEDTGTTVTFTTDDEPVLLTFDTQTNNFVPVVGELTNRQETMWLRTFQINNNATTVVVNDNGEPVVLFNRNGSTKFLKAEYDNGDLAITETNDNETLTALETEAGGLAEITVEDSSDGDFHKYIDSENDGYYFITNQDSFITFGEVNIWPPVTQKLYAITKDGDTHYYLGNYEGKVLAFTYGVDTVSHCAIEYNDETSEWDFSEFRGEISDEYVQIEVPVETTDGNTLLFNLYGIDYVLVGYGMGGEPWLTPNNVVEYA